MMLFQYYLYLFIFNTKTMNSNNFKLLHLWTLWATKWVIIGSGNGKLELRHYTFSQGCWKCHLLSFCQVINVLNRNIKFISTKIVTIKEKRFHDYFVFSVEIALPMKPRLGYSKGWQTAHWSNYSLLSGRRPVELVIHLTLSGPNDQAVCHRSLICIDIQLRMFLSGPKAKMAVNDFRTSFLIETMAIESIDNVKIYNVHFVYVMA